MAVDNTGRIYTINESGKIQRISPDKLAEDMMKASGIKIEIHSPEK